MSFVQGDYLTFQGGILKIILSNLTNDELKHIRTVSKEWNRTVTNILDTQKKFESIVYQVEPAKDIDWKRIKLEPEQFSVIFCNKKVFTKLRGHKIINDHLLNVRELKQVRFISGRYLPSVIIDISEPYLNYWMKKGINGAALNHSLRNNKSVDVSIFQLQYSWDHNEVEKALREYNNDDAIKSIMVFLNPRIKRKKLEEAQSVEKFFRTVVERVQTEPFISAGLTVNNDVLLPKQFNNCKCEFQATILVYRGKGLKVTSDLFYWDSDDSADEFTNFINQLCVKAGPKPEHGKRVMYIFECYAVRHYIWNDFNTLMAQVVEMDIEVVFVRSKYNEFFTSPFDNRPHSQFYDGLIRQYSTIVSIYDYSDVHSTWKDVNLTRQD